MPTTRTEARDEILTLAKEVFDTFTNFVAIYDDSRVDIPKEDDDPLKSWARALVRHVTGAQSTLSSGGGKRRYTKNGLLTIQLFTPLGDGLTDNDAKVASLEAKFRNVSTANGVWFRNVRSNEIGVDGPWFQTNVLAEFEYDELG